MGNWIRRVDIGSLKTFRITSLPVRLTPTFYNWSHSGYEYHFVTELLVYKDISTVEDVTFSMYQGRIQPFLKRGFQTQDKESENYQIIDCLRSKQCVDSLNLLWDECSWSLLRVSFDLSFNLMRSNVSLYSYIWLSVKAYMWLFLFFSFCWITLAYARSNVCNKVNWNHDKKD